MLVTVANMTKIMFPEAGDDRMPFPIQDGSRELITKTPEWVV